MLQALHIPKPGLHVLAVLLTWAFLYISHWWFKPAADAGGSRSAASAEKKLANVGIGTILQIGVQTPRILCIRVDDPSESQYYSMDLVLSEIRGIFKRKEEVFLLWDLRRPRGIPAPSVVCE